MTTILLPAEWAPQDAILLTWPHADSDWRPWLTEADRAFATLAAAISRYETVVIGCHDHKHSQHVRNLLNAAGANPERCRLHVVPSNDVWARDHGPLAVYRDGRPVLLDFRFNGWGGKFACELDDRITARLHELGAFGATPREPVDLILEGGSIESDGRGTLLATAQCLLDPNRNGLDQATLEQRLRETLGFTRFLWLRHGHLAGDDTDSHIDTLARFCDPFTIAYQNCEDPDDPHFESLQAMAEELRAFRTVEGEPYRLVDLPLPAARHDQKGRRLPAGYANFLILNGAVLMPTYGDPQDAAALDRLRGCFPQREVIGVPCAILIRQCGSLHCVTMQLPAGVLPAPG
ncbi:MAG: agmatine deiminase family protein [Candidatus Competibacter sp.]|nr:agmatine deiminase family protein [Candidatus Competibacter sp.]